MILTPLQKLPKNVGDLGKIIVATGFEKLPKVQKIAQSGHTALQADGLAHGVLWWKERNNWIGPAVKHVLNKVMHGLYNVWGLT